MTESSRRKARSWPYPRQRNYERSLRGVASAWFARKGFSVQKQYPFILANWDHWPRNIVLLEVVHYINLERARRQQERISFPLHKYLHHGLSSQAMLFNLVGPLIIRNDLEPLKAALEQSGVPWPAGNCEASFEREDRQVFNEDSGQPTSIDLVIEAEAATAPVFIECKLGEKEFGGCSVFAAGDCDGRNPAQDFQLCYLHHLGRRYWTLLEQYGFLCGLVGNGATCILATYYQFFREVLFALEKGGYFVLLHDERSPAFVCKAGSQERGLFVFLRSLVPENLTSRVQAVTVQQAVDAIKLSGRHQDWITEFEAKYGLV